MHHLQINWLLFLVTCVVSAPLSDHDPVKEPFKIEHLTHHPGLFYEKLPSVKLIDKEWKIITTIDFTAFRTKILRETKPHLTQALSSCNTNFGLDCERLLKVNQFGAMQQEAEILNQHLEDILKETETFTAGRAKRAPLFGFIGTLQHKFFGVMDYNDYEHVTKEIDKLYQGQSQITHLVNNATHIIRSEIESLSSHIDKSNKNIAVLKEATLVLQKDQTILREKIIEMEISAKQREIGEEIEHAMKILLETTRKIIDAIDAAKHGKISHTFLSPEQLNRAADKIRNAHPELEFPIPKGKVDYPTLSKVSSIQIAHTQGKVLAVISIPLSNRNLYQLYRIHPLKIPQQANNQSFSAHIKPAKPYILVTEDRHHYALLDQNILNECAPLGNELICLPSFPVSSSSMKPRCEVMMLLKPSEEVFKLCDIRMSNVRGTEWINLGSTNKWLFSTAEAEYGQLYCQGQPEGQLEITGTGLINLEPGCHLQTPADLISHAGALQSTKIDIHLPAANLNISKISPNITKSPHYPNSLSEVQVDALPHLKHQTSFDVKLDEAELRLEEIGLQHQENYKHKLMVFGSMGGVGLLTLIGITYALYKWKIGGPLLTCLLRCCCRKSKAPKTKPELESKNKAEIQLEQLTLALPANTSRATLSTKKILAPNASKSEAECNHSSIARRTPTPTQPAGTTQQTNRILDL